MVEHDETVIKTHVAIGQFEVISQATISKRQGFLSEAGFNQMYSACEKQSKMLSGLRRSLLESPA